MNSETKWTPGPWIIDDKSPEFIKSSEGEVIAMAARRNAHLIAAAPELYEALADAEQFIKKESGGGETDYREKLLLVLAKARGEVTP